jgi:hypothetical protein
MAWRFKNLEGVKKVLAIDLDGKNGIRPKNKDRVTIITGYEGMGKSTLALHIFEIWFNLLNIPITKELIEFFGDNQKNFIIALNSAPRYYMVVHDEAGKDVYTRNAMSSFSRDLNVAYQVIRGANLHTLLLIPNILDIDSFFRKRRVTQCFHVYKEGCVAYYSKKRLKKILPAIYKMGINNDDVNLLSAGAPLFYDTFPMYEGVLKDFYLERKTQNILETKKYLLDKYVTETPKNDKKESQYSNFTFEEEIFINTYNKFHNPKKLF